ncbi:MAG: hypothetical protein K2X93_02305 [Candidatus Obscuribacterales bacterium]|nr:hypothetical protein [Candidatus Obscuribacterales bacterium]
MAPESKSETAPSATATKSRRRGLWICLALFIVCLTVVRSLSWAPTYYETKEDDSWELMLYMLAQRGALCGKDYVFTFGPLGFMYGAAFYPTMFDLKLILQSIFCALTATVMVLQGQRIFTHRVWTLVWIFSLIAIYGFFRDVYFFAVPLLLVNQFFLIDEKDRKLPSLESTILVTLLAVAAVIKFTYFVAGAWLMFFITLDQLLIRRSKPILPLVFLSVTLVAWLCVGQPLDTLPTYIMTSLEVAAGHSEAMTYSESGWLAPFATMMLAAGLIFVGFTRLAYKRGGREAVFAALAESGLFF